MNRHIPQAGILPGLRVSERGDKSSRRHLVPVRDPLVIPHHVVLHAEYDRNRRHGQYDHGLPMCKRGAEVKMINHFNQEMAEHRAREQAEPYPELTADSQEDQAQHKCDQQHHVAFERHFQALKRNCCARAFALPALEQHIAEQEEEHGNDQHGCERRCRLCKHRPSITPPEIIIGTNAEIQDHRRRIIADPVQNAAPIPVAQILLAKRLPNHPHGWDGAQQPAVEQHGKDRVAGQDGREHRHRINKQEKQYMRQQRLGNAAACD